MKSNTARARLQAFDIKRFQRALRGREISQGGLALCQTDGGRAAAGYKTKHPRDCVARAIALVTEQPYRTVYRDLCALTATMTGGVETKLHDGTSKPVIHAYLASRGWRVTVTRGKYLRDIPRPGRYLVLIPGHMTAVIDGTVHDSWDCRVSRRTRSGWPVMEAFYTPPPPVGGEAEEGLS